MTAAGWTALDDYRVAREAGELDRDRRTLGYAADEEMDKDKGGRQPITYRQWLKGRADAGPAPDEEITLAISTAREAVAEAEAFARTAVAYADQRDAEVADLVRLGLSYAEIADVLGVSKQRVGQYVARHKAAGKVRRG